MFFGVPPFPRQKLYSRLRTVYKNAETIETVNQNRQARKCGQGQLKRDLCSEKCILGLQYGTFDTPN